jgi:pyrimidine-specific ribonucleoside hydrolase
MQLVKQIKGKQRNKSMRNIIIDCDPGHDDAIAILMALAHKEELNILGITTVGGNQLLEKVTKNTLKILSLVDENIPVASGEAKALTREIHTGADAHGETGMDGPVLPEPKYAIVSDKAVQFMYEKIMASKEKVTLVPLGPLTNIALLLRTYPEIKSSIELICLMGGGIHVGNRTAAAEFNIYVDPEAAKIVFNSGVDIVMAGLDVTNKAMIMEDEREQLRGKGKVSNFVSELLDFYSQASKRFGFEGSSLHDPCAIGYLLRPDLFKGKRYPVDIETQGELTRGMTLADERPVTEKEPNTLVLLEVKRKEFVDFVCNCIEKLDIECNNN